MFFILKNNKLIPIFVNIQNCNEVFYCQFDGVPRNDRKNFYLILKFNILMKKVTQNTPINL